MQDLQTELIVDKKSVGGSQSFKGSSTALVNSTYLSTNAYDILVENSSSSKNLRLWYYKLTHALLNILKQFSFLCL